MKPKWSDAPDWANALAQDANGTWHWYEDADLELGANQWYCNGRYLIAGEARHAWRTSKEMRPC